MNKIKDWFRKYSNLIFLILWMILWVAAFVKVRHPIEDVYTDLGILFGWLWSFMFVSDMFDWGKPTNYASGELEE